MHCNFHRGYIYHLVQGGVYPFDFLLPLEFGGVVAPCRVVDRHGNPSPGQETIDVHIQYCDFLLPL